MTALLGRDGSDFSLVCDACGWVIGNLEASTGDWRTAWDLFVLDGWSGSELAVGPHGCGRCGPPPSLDGIVARSLDGIVARSLDAPSLRPAGRAVRRMVLQLLSDVRVIYLHGELVCADDARLYDLLSGDPGRFVHVMVDVTRVGRLSSATLDVLVRAAQRAALDGGRTCLVGAGPVVTRSLRMLCLDDILPVHPEHVVALEWLRSGRSVTC
ncbi:STAS domain-containing protein [Dactylosporangium matsuzakiense]|uniref:STAS domain-containing protein n=1 Tax=Dactylosporangium matsuzakiense TaxID=53360 RepID=A0A9W6NKK6_9ACTN|nr:STAS domain-containing protein [Dactylosporangium matsuzakiense]UWZ42252.1 STAS domain-containing protein [Dactylosporangium matsuzakiense]GLK99906.1 hypothetical protein GCM10017581_016470 [Dactylosporangium matsuzakiense]